MNRDEHSLSELLRSEQTLLNPYSVWIFDVDGLIHSLNPAARNVLGVEPGASPGHISDYLTVDSLHRFRHGAMSAATVKSAWHGTVLMKPKSGASFLSAAALVYSPRTTVLDEFYFLFSQPIVGGSESRREPASHRPLLAKVMETLDEAIFVVEFGSRQVTFCNRAAVEMFGYSQEELVGHSTIKLHVDEQHYERFMELISETVRATGRCTCEFRMRRKDGTIFDSAHWISVLDRESGEPSASVSVIRDITSVKRIEQEKLIYENRLRALATRLDAFESDERREVAAYLHDEVAQFLALAKNHLEEMKSDPKMHLNSKLDEVEHLITRAIGGTRASIGELYSAALHQLGLIPALEVLCDDLMEPDGAGIALDVLGVARELPELHRRVLFAATREALMNAVRHADAQSIQLSFKYLSDGVEVTVEDDGTGFATISSLELPGTFGGFGIFHATEQLRYVGGELEIETAPGDGTRVHIRARGI